MSGAARTGFLNRAVILNFLFPEAPASRKLGNKFKKTTSFLTACMNVAQAKG